MLADYRLIRLFNLFILLWGSVFFLNACSVYRVNRNTKIREIESELFFYHNGSETVVKDYKSFELLKPFLDSNGIESDQNWVPGDGSSRCTYFQFINRDSVYIEYSFEFDSTIVNKHKLSKRLSYGFPLIKEYENTYKCSDTVVNKSVTEIYLFTFHGNELHVILEYEGAIISSPQAFIAYPIK